MMKKISYWKWLEAKIIMSFKIIWLSKSKFKKWKNSDQVFSIALIILIPAMVIATFYIWLIPVFLLTEFLMITYTFYLDDIEEEIKKYNQ